MSNSGSEIRRAPQAGVHPSHLRAAVFLLLGALGANSLSGQVEDLGGQAQGIVDQMRAQGAYWTPAMQQQSATANASGTVSQVQESNSGFSYSPAQSAAAQRQMAQQEIRIEQMQQRQQLMMAGAQMAGQIAGQWLAEQLLSSGPSPQEQLEAQMAEQARQAELIRQQQERTAQATQSRTDWDQRDAGMSNDLTDILGSPGPKSTAFFGIEGNPDPASVPSAPSLAADGPGPAATALDPNQAPDFSTVIQSASPETPALAPEYLAALEQRAAQTATNLDISSSTVSSQLSNLEDAGTALGQVAKGKLISYGEKVAVDEVKGTSAYAQFTDALQYVPGYEWAMKAKKAFDYASNLKGQFDALKNPLEAVNERTLGVFEYGASGAVASNSNIGSSGSDFSEDYWQRVTDRGNDYYQTSMSLIKQQISTGLNHSNARDAAILQGTGN